MSVGRGKKRLKFNKLNFSEETQNSPVYTFLQTAFESLNIEINEAKNDLKQIYRIYNAFFKPS